MTKYTEPFCGVTVVPFKIIDGHLHVRLYKRSNAPVFNNQYCLPNSFVDPTMDSNIDATANRALIEKTNISTHRGITQLKTYSGSHIDPRGWSVVSAYICFNPKGSDGYVKYEDAIKLVLAFNHLEILKDAKERLSNRATYSNMPCYLLDDEFTLRELQSTYEHLIDSKLDKSSFRKAIKDTNMAVSTGGVSSTNGRPAQLYCINKDFIGNFFPKKIK